MLLKRDPPTKWPQLIDELQSSGYSYRGMAAAINVPWPTLQSWKKGVTPNYEDGKALVKLHRIMCSDAIERDRA